MFLFPKNGGNTIPVLFPKNGKGGLPFYSQRTARSIPKERQYIWDDAMKYEMSEEKLKLKKGHIVLLKAALEGLMPDRLESQIEQVIKKKIALKDDLNPPEFDIIDDTWDGQEDKRTRYRFNMDKMENRLFSFYFEKFGNPFAAVYLFYSLECAAMMAGKMSKRTLRRRLADFQRTVFRDVDFGELQIGKTKDEAGR
jgi:hypothetical protein